MKMKHVKVAVLLMAGCLLSTSCVGSFSLFNKVAAWNKTATKNKFLNEIIFLVISPVYGICSFADALVLNSIEFWTGENPLTSSIGKTKQVMGEDGRYYAVKTLKNGYEITSPEGEKQLFTYDKASNSWVESQGGKTQELFRFNSDGTVRVVLPSGKAMDVSLNNEGINELRGAMSVDALWAKR
ncbi:MAG: DUF3332 domain-containing protein [Prevotellaceae bacterium]|jgi:putative lipoprotein|nr:DUF3332 domain-containing protein [Prevotellaceae bacterium]MBF1061233.1 DUF3332 domain-containing protein [Prevotellaceae bacterium]MBF1073141.1 DUF3332 domain-containing protein [Prevotellaceae bacterium]MBF1079385.1 DUF3332 domain-containing protein [Prevotellaceae bacterium]MBF1081019.1 DUF3332 domain-containing protein [Prevotellaceae bacterium]